MLACPVLFLVFNRPAPTRVVFDRIRAARPSRLYVAADGPRSGVAADADNCAMVRAVVENVDWPCRVKTLFRDRNLGCRQAVSEALTWFFTEEEEGIVLEDDIVPDGSFFPFCVEMLARYRADQSVMHVAGFNMCGRWRDEEQSYHYSRFGGIWGWASWRRAWRHYDVNIAAWSDVAVQRRVLQTYFPRELHSARKKLYDDLHAGRIDTWDYQWTLCRLIRDGHCIVPARNLVQNIGFGGVATHTQQMPRWVTNETFSLDGPWSTRTAGIDSTYDRLHLLLSTHNLSFAECQKLAVARGRSPALV